MFQSVLPEGDLNRLKHVVVLVGLYVKAYVLILVHSSVLSTKS